MTGFESKPKLIVGLPSKLTPSLDADQVRSEILSLDGIYFLPSSLTTFLPCNIIARVFLPLLLVIFHLNGRLEDALAA